MMASSIISIGDELLAGFTQDTNSHWLAQRLRLLGHPLKRITTVRDRQPEIVEALRHDLDDPEITDVFTQGGLGPTPDDRTFPAIAAALGRELAVWEETRARIERRLQRMHEAQLIDSPELSEGSLKMARIPAEPAHVFRNRRGMAPGVLYESNGTRLFVLPGVPMELKGIFTEEIEPEFLTGHAAAHVRELRFRFAIEGTFFPLLQEAEEKHPAVSVGSYPNFETKALTIRCTGEDAREVEAVTRLIRTRASGLGFEPEPV